MSHSSPGSRRASLGGTPSPLRSPAAPSAQAHPFFTNYANPPLTTSGATGAPSSTFVTRQQFDFMRRRSVDVGVLGVGMHRQGNGAPSRRVREAVGPDAGDKEFGLVGAGAKGGKDRLLGRHLASLLAHSLSLCSEPQPPPTDEVHFDTDPLASDEGRIPTKVLPPIPGSVDSSPSASRNTSVSTGSLSFSAAGSSLSERIDEPAGAVPPLHASAPSAPKATSFPVISEAKRCKLIASLQSWSFNAMGHSSDDLLSCVGIIFEGVRNMEGVDFDLTQYRSLLLLLRSAYHARNGYHNFSHATDVTQACYSFLVRMGLAPPLYLLCEDDYDANLGEGRRKWRRNRAVEESGMGELLRPMDVFALMVAAIGHDVGHPGLSNAYMINARTPVAQIYDSSVLENFHTVTLIHMLRRSGFGHLLGGEFGCLGENATEFRKVLEASILATDMSRHFSFVNEITDLGRRFDERRESDLGSLESDRLLLCSGLMKCADISNPTRPHRISRAWSTALLEEWSVQAATERQYGLPISVMTIDHVDTKAQAKSQVGFIDLFAKPLFDAMAKVVDEFADFAEKLRDGRIAWEAISLQGDEAFRQAPLGKEFELSPAPVPRAPSRNSSGAPAEGGVEDESPATPRIDSHSGAPRPSSPLPPSATTPQPGKSPASLPSSRGYPDDSIPPVPVRPIPVRGRPSPIRPDHIVRHNRQFSSESSSSTNLSPLSPLFPASVSSIATGTSVTASTPSEYASPFPTARGGLGHPSAQLGSDLSASFKATCGGACTTTTAMCEVCARKIEAAAVRRGSLGRALAGIEQREAEELEQAEYDGEDAVIETDPSIWPPYPFMPTRASAQSPLASAMG
ncbi:BZ3500_MvSof-1268-A1-R1_Chr3-1g05628 [Microbotryum saponariae]|uniref:Phosphodiesterase n=1 Tax=Microbotryum saponariae TaxID=289078 RepID=A0A2X0L1V3_9BASI|nr:BZ3500_MvSof-1268-A1-R1_Chr3-1g05628 [Microbotryum saponariae]SDA04818.1 BZ3501_MvSof-1269-A2-R1_Chr3-1g05298 [Microbotryum saponariae]